MAPTVLDLNQLARIQGTHRGFLYQHLYAAACLLASPQTGVLRVRVERDEDVELVHAHQVVYAQVKTSPDPLAPSDIRGLLDRFDEIRAVHQRGDRAGLPRFALVANTELGPTLAAHAWPSDVLVITPTTSPHVFQGTGLVAAPRTVEALLLAAQATAGGFRLSALRPESLIAKLVGIIARAAAGEWPEQSFATADLDRICELVAAQLRPLPRVARVYRAHHDEPTLPDGRGSLVVVGHAGDGKTAWASEVAAHTEEVAVYLPCSSAPGEQIAPRLVEAALATVVARGNIRAHELVLPGRTGLDALALLDAQLTSRGIALMAIIDDCHHAPAQLIIETLRAAPGFRWLLLARPGETASEVVASTMLPREVLGGWDDDVIASLLHEAGCSTRPADVSALRTATNGAPLFVLHAVRAIADGHQDTGEYARALIGGTTAGRSPQESLLEGAVRALDPAVARIATAIASIDIGLTGDEWIALLSNALADAPVAARRSLRALVDLQIAQETGNAVVTLHDAFRPLLVARFLSRDETRRVREEAASLLRSALLDERAAERIVAYARILASLGRLSQLAELSNALSEWIRETGTIAEIRGHIEVSLTEAALSDEDRFWALDTLAFFDIEDELPKQAAGRLPEMEQLAHGLDDQARGALQHKKALVALRSGDFAGVRRLLTGPAPDPRYARILRYHAALAEAYDGRVAEAAAALSALADEYLAELGLSQRSMFGKGPAELRAIMRADADPADIRHLADCYDAIRRITARDPRFRREGAMGAVWSMKFYDLAGSERSVLRAGQEMVDVMLGLWEDPEAARAFLEDSLLPAAARARLPEMTIPIRAQYAVICAHCRDFARADDVMAALAPYADGLPPEGRAELENQRTLIQALRARGPLTAGEAAARRQRLEAQTRIVDELRAALELGADATKPIRTQKVGRNDACPCGSGKKYKKCYGASG